MNIGIIGSGEMGSFLAFALGRLGHHVSIANSRGPSSLTRVVELTGVVPADIEGAIKNQEIVIIAIPTKSIPDLPKTLFRQLEEEVVVIDTTNYYPLLRDGILPELEQSWIESMWVQEQLSVPVVKVFNSILATSLQTLGRPEGHPDRIALAISGDKVKSRQVAANLVGQLGFDAADLGDLGQSWKQQPGSPIYCRDISLTELNNRLSTLHGDWSALRSTLLARRKADELLMRQDYQAYLQSLKRQ